MSMCAASESKIKIDTNEPKMGKRNVYDQRIGSQKYSHQNHISILAIAIALKEFNFYLSFYLKKKNKIYSYKTDE